VFIRDNFERQRKINVSSAAKDLDLVKKGRDFLVHADKYQYGYFWRFMGLPIIQMPEDIVLTQEILWELKPNIVIEAGVAWGGSLLMYAAFQEIGKKGKTFGIDLVTPDHNKAAIMNSPVSHRITLIEGSSTDLQVFNQITQEVKQDDRILLVLDSNHTESHVLEELKLWTPLLKKGDVLIVSDTIVEDIPIQTHRPRPWGPGNNPKTALLKFLETTDRFSYDNDYSLRALNSFNPTGFLFCIK
jgi:cephalosporin hydroxylase